MKGLMAKLKGMPFKEMMVAHGEKAVLGVVGLIVLMALMTTTWAGIDKRPDDLLANATLAQAKLNTGEWPAEKAAAFKPSTYQTTAVSMFTEMNEPEVVSAYSYDKAMTFPLYKREEPRGEVDYPPVHQLIADAGTMVLGKNPPPVDLESMEAEPEEDDFPRAAPKKAKAATKSGHSAPMNPMGSMMPDMMAGMNQQSTGLQPQGQRYVAVRGIVNLFEIGRAIQLALHLETPADGMALIDVVDFTVERQKAVAGANPWPEDTWQVLSLERADEVLEECSLAADLVETGCISPVYTMPLPTRLDGDYTRIVSHPSLERFELSKEQREMEQKLNAAFLDTAAEMGVEENAGKRRGFMKNQIDMNAMRNGVMSSPGANMMDMMKKAGINSGPGGMMPATGGGHGGGKAPAMPPMMMMPRPAAATAGGHGGGGGPRMPGMMPPPGMMPGMNMGGMGGAGAPMVGANAVGTLMLFRYLDFDVNPGEAYRYRVKLEFANPNFDISAEKVKEASVAEGETRFSSWSEPSAPVIVKADTNVFLADVDKKARTRGEASIQMYQWDPSLGTYIDSKVMAKFGQFIGGLAKSEQLDLAIPSLGEKTVLFASKDFLLDTVLPPVILPSEHPDLNLQLDARQAKDGLELPSEAVVLDEYGRLKVLDSVSERKAASEASDKVKAERKPWEALKDTGKEKNALDTLGAGAAAAGMMMPPGMATPSSVSKRGRGGKAGGAGMMPGAGPMMPFGPGAAGGKK